jgi:octaprenyl-diphosphate synthase
LYKKELSQKQMQWIKEQMRQTHALQEAIELAQKLGQQAIEALKDENSEELIEIMRAMIEREF